MCKQNRSSAFRTLSATAAVGVGVVSLGFGTLSAFTGFVKDLVPGIHAPVKPPSALVKKASKVEGAKGFAGGVGRVIPAVAGLWAGNEVTNKYGNTIDDTLEPILPGEGGGVIKQPDSDAPGACYTESSEGIKHVDCKNLKK